MIHFIVDNASLIDVIKKTNVIKDLFVGFIGESERRDIMLIEDLRLENNMLIFKTGWHYDVRDNFSDYRINSIFLYEEIKKVK